MTADAHDMNDNPPAEPSAASGSDEPNESNVTNSPAPAPWRNDNVEQQDFANPTMSIITSLSRKKSTSALSLASGLSREGTPPPLPPRPNLNLLDSSSRPSTSHSIAPGRPRLVSKATTQLSFADSANHKNESREPSSSRLSKPRSYFGLNLGSPTNTSDGEDSASVKSVLPAGEAGLDAESMLGEGLGDHEKPLLGSLSTQTRDPQTVFEPDPVFEQAFAGEFDEVDELASDGSNEESIMKAWRAKLKHFLILSSAGKPIYSRHGDDQLITNYIGVVQTLISFYQSTDDTLRGFTAGDVRFVVMSKGPLNLVAITRLPESDAQLRAQLDALYMQILSTLTLPSMQRMFAARANYDLRRPLQGTETLLSALADGFTRGSLSTLLGALECLKLRKSHRQKINDTLLKTRSPNLLYGLVVASGKLVSVVRPKKHSLHPGDLHLIFNMLFEAGSVKAGGGENWIPLCLPGFNNTGYLYMYVSFLNLEHPNEQMQERPKSREGDTDEVAVLLISAEKEGFFEMRGMRDELVEHLNRNAGLRAIRHALQLGLPTPTALIPGTPLLHFLYKSRPNVQFFAPSFAPHFASPVARRRLLNVYAALHAQLHGKPTSLKIVYGTGGEEAGVVSLGWITPAFEMYAVAGEGTGRAALARAAEAVVRWVGSEEGRVFIIGGAVF